MRNEKWWCGATYIKRLSSDFPLFPVEGVPAGAEVGSGMFSVAPAESIAPAEPGRILLGKH